MAWTVSACSIIPGESAAGFGLSTSETVSRDNTPEFVDGVLERHVRLTVPPGGLDSVVSGLLSIGVSTSTPEPFPDVELMIGPPIEDSVVVDEVGNPVWEWDLPLPEDCQDGCEILVPVSFEQIGEGSPPMFIWSASFGFEYESESLKPAAAEDMTAVIEPADSE